MLKNVTLSSAYQIWEADRSCMLSLDNRYQGLSAAHVGQIHVLVLRGKGIFLKKKITIEKLLKVFFKLLWLGSRPLPPSPPSWRRCSSQSWTLLSHRMRWRLQSSFGFPISTLKFHWGSLRFHIRWCWRGQSCPIWASLDRQSQWMTPRPHLRWLEQSYRNPILHKIINNLRPWRAQQTHQPPRRPQNSQVPPPLLQCKWVRWLVNSIYIEVVELSIENCPI